MNIHHQRALAVLAGAACLDVVLGTLYAVVMGISVPHGLYCATGTATTVGCDVTPAGWAAYLLSAAEMLTIVPLFASVFSFITAGLTASHIDAKTKAQTTELKEHVSDTARRA